MKTLRLLQMTLIISLWATGVACLSQEASSSDVANNKFTVELNELIPETNVSPSELVIQEVSDLDNQPRILHYGFNSDYVVEASLSDKVKIISKVDKKETRKDIYNLEDNVAAFVNLLFCDH